MNLAPHSQRAQVTLTQGDPPVDEPSECYDRFPFNYVFDLPSEEVIRDVLREAHRMLRPEGLLCLSGLSTGVSPVSRTVARTWNWIQAHGPTTPGLLVQSGWESLMGGSGSIRWRGHRRRALVEETHCLDLLDRRWKEILSSSGLIPQLRGSGWGVLTTMMYLFSTNAQRGLAWGLRLGWAGIFERDWTVTN